MNVASERTNGSSTPFCVDFAQANVNNALYYVLLIIIITYYKINAAYIEATRVLLLLLQRCVYVCVARLKCVIFSLKNHHVSALHKQNAHTQINNLSQTITIKREFVRWNNKRI